MILIANLHTRLISSRAMNSLPVEFLNVLYQSDCCCCVFGAGPSSFRRMWCPMATLDGDKSFIFSLLTINEAEDKQMNRIRLRAIQTVVKIDDIMKAWCVDVSNQFAVWPLRLLSGRCVFCS